MRYRAEITFEAPDNEEARQIFELMQEAFCNQDKAKALRAFLWNDSVRAGNDNIFSQIASAQGRE